MFCGKCGNELTEGIRFCTQCGTSADSAISRPRPTPAKNRGGVGFLGPFLIVVGAITAIVGGYSYVNYSTESRSFRVATLGYGISEVYQNIMYSRVAVITGLIVLALGIIVVFMKKMDRNR